MTTFDIAARADVKKKMSKVFGKSCMEVIYGKTGEYMGLKSYMGSLNYQHLNYLGID